MIVQESTVDLPTPTGVMKTYLSRPVAPGRRPGVVLFSEIFQRTGPVRRMAAVLAGHGFIVLVPEIFHELEPPGSVLAYDPPGTERGNYLKTAKPVAAYDADARACLDHLAQRDDCNGTLLAAGVCIGGHLAFRCALDPRVRRAACFYATDLHKGTLGLGGDDSLARAEEISGELLMVWGRQDPHVPEEGRAKIQARLREAKRHFTWHEFNAAHAFLRDEGARYDPALALLSYRMMIDLFQQA
jgi:carboxymethylenebutenolidase